MNWTKLACAFFLLAVPGASAQVAPAPTLPRELVVAAKGAVVLDSFSGSFLWEKNPGVRYFPASATKILTAMLVIEKGRLDEPVTVVLEDTKVEPSSLYMKPGETYTRRQLLYGLMLKSANDVAMLLARDNAGSVAAFAEKMTKRAAQLGATESHFMNPHGLHHPQHYTTPRDLALISRAAMQLPYFREIAATRTFTWESPKGLVPVNNHNRLLARYPGCIGLKTGFTNPAQQVLVSSALREGREYLAVVLHTNKPGIWEDSMKLLDFGFASNQF
ncbi:MAG TPA: D-alanyl-D-alanine carboxypeptidase family protein [Chthoniobacterales bacterium]|jgi:D-alanyl-D-alanine carboxypeptidase (penicillin-binding protein 5/6)